MFLKNIESLKKSNPKLALKLENYTFDRAREFVDIAKSKSEDIIFIKNNTPLESVDNPVEEAFYNVQSNIKNSLDKFDFIVMYGLGVGYTLDYVFEKYESRLLILEPDLNVLRVAFEMVDYTVYLDTGRVFITDVDEDIYNYISEKYIVNDKVEIIFMKQYLPLYGENIKDFTQKIYETCLLKMSDVNTIKKNSEFWVYSSIAYIKNSGQTYPISILDNKFEGRTALIIGAGPSLKDNIENIKKYRDRFVIFAVNRAIDFLAVNDVIPDFGVFTDTKSIKNVVRTNVPHMNEINFIVDIKADSFVYDLVKKRCFVYFPDNYELAKELCQNNSYIKLYETAGTSTFCALISAKNLGCKNIILCGCDLAFKNNDPYCYPLKMTVVTENELKQGSMTKKIVKVKSVTGKMVNTRDDYAIFIKQFEKFFRENSQLNIYNITNFGAYIEGVINLELSKIIEQIDCPYDFKSNEDIINNALYYSEFNPIELKKSAKKFIKKEERENFEIRAAVKSVLDIELDDDIFFVRTMQILEKISKTIFLSQLIQFELLSCTKNITLKDSVQKRANFELFLEGIFEKIDVLNKKLAEI